MISDGYVDNKFTWFIGVVEDIDDPLKMNRTRVRAYGYHSDDSNILKTEDLPWATVMMPTTSASFKGIGSNHELVVGSWVVGFFRDGPSAQDPIVMGSIATQTDGTIDIPTEAQLNPPSNKLVEYNKHTDQKFKCKAAIYYVNSNDGYTIIGNQKIESKANRIVFFDADQQHSGTNSTDCKNRMVINFNYF